LHLVAGGTFRSMREKERDKDLNPILFSSYYAGLQHQQPAIERTDTSLNLFIALTTLHSSTQVKL